MAITVGPAFALWLGYGIGSYANRIERVWSPVFEMGAAVKLGKTCRWR